MSDAPYKEQRHYHRVVHDARATLFTSAGDRPCRLRDLSLKGCLLEAQADWHLNPNATYRLAVWLAPDLQMEMSVIPAHEHGRLAGFQCVDMDLDSAATLRRLVELNLGDTTLLERDLQSLVTGD